MEIWRRDDGVEFDSEEGAYLDSLEYCDDELADTLCNIVDDNKLLCWAMQQDGFWEAFDDEITEARGMLFEDYYTCWDESELEEEDEIEALIAEIRASSRPKSNYKIDRWGNLYEVNPTE